MPRFDPESCQSRFWVDRHFYLVIYVRACTFLFFAAGWQGVDFWEGGATERVRCEWMETAVVAGMDGCGRVECDPYPLYGQHTSRHDDLWCGNLGLFSL